MDENTQLHYLDTVGQQLEYFNTRIFWKFSTKFATIQVAVRETALS